MYLCQHGVTLKYVSPIEIVIIGGAQFKHMLNIGTVPLHVTPPFTLGPVIKNDDSSNHSSYFMVLTFTVYCRRLLKCLFLKKCTCACLKIVKSRLYRFERSVAYKLRLD